MQGSQFEQLTQAMRALRAGLGLVLGFSLAINLLMLATPLYMLQVYDRVLASRSTDTLLLLTLVVVAALLTLASLEAVRTFLMVKLGHWLDRRLSGNLLGASVVRALSRERDANVQGLRDLSTLRTFLTGPSVFPIMDAPWTPIFLAFIFILHPVLGWFATGGAIVLFLVAVTNEIWTRGLVIRSGAMSIRAMEKASSAARNADVVEAMGLMPDLVKRWHRINDEALGLQATASQRSGVLGAAAKFIRLFMQIAMLGGGAYFVLVGEMTAGGIIAASILIGRALAPIDQAITSWRSALAARSAYQRIADLLRATPTRGEGMQLPTPSGTIEVENLAIGFPGMRKPLLRSVSFSLAAGEMLGLIGPSGSGKTTLVRSLLGNLTPVSGHARLDGMDVCEWDPEDRGRHVGYLPQDVELFSTTIRENIARMGDGDPDEVVAAAKWAGVHELVLRMPKGYDTPIGDYGMTLSGGERQRVALARALYGGPRFVVLDEPSASLDREGEAALLICLRRLKESRVTTIVIAHRPAILEYVDKVMVLQEGTVDAFGPREEVLRSLAVRGRPQTVVGSRAPGAAPDRHA